MQGNTCLFSDHCLLSVSIGKAVRNRNFKNEWEFWAMNTIILEVEAFKDTVNEGIEGPEKPGGVVDMLGKEQDEHTSEGN